MQPHLSLCRSATHRALLGLLPPAVGLAPPPGLARDLARAVPEDLAALAAVDHAQTVLSAAFERSPELLDAAPGDLVLYWQEMHAANCRRNAAALAQLAALAGLLRRAGIPAVALKGGAELLAPTWAAPGRRFLQDLDILVDPAAGEAAQAALFAAGATSVPEATVPEGEHHYPPMTLPGYPFVVELHIHLGGPRIRAVLPAADVLAEAVPTGIAGLAVPSLRHRARHAVVHAQWNHELERRQVLSPRALLDYHGLAGALGPEGRAALRRSCTEAGLAEALDAFDAMTATVFGCDPEAAGRLRWTREALRLYGRPVARRRALLAEIVRNVARRLLTDPATRRRYARKMLNPRAVAAYLGNYRRRLRWTR